MDKENIRDCLPMNPILRTPLQDVKNNGRSPCDSPVCKDPHSPVTPQLKADSPLHSENSVAQRVKGPEDVALNALIYQKVMGILNEKEMKFRHEVSEKDVVIEELKKALQSTEKKSPVKSQSSKLSKTPKRRSRLPVFQPESSKSVSNALDKKVIEKKPPVKPRLNAIPLRTRILKKPEKEPVIKTKDTDTDRSIKKTKNTPVSANRIVHHTRNLSRSEITKLGKHVCTQTEGDCLEGTNCQDEYNERREALIDDLSEKLKRYVLIINDLRREIETLKSEKLCSEDMINQQGIEYLKAEIDAREEEIYRLRSEVNKLQKSDQEMLKVKEQLKILQQTTQETETFMEEERFLLSNELSMKETRLLSVQEQLSNANDQIQSAAEQQKALQYTLDLTKARAHALLLDKTSEIETSKDAASSLVASLSALLSRLQGTGNAHTAEDTCTLDKSAMEGEDGKDLLGMIELCNDKTSAIDQLWSQKNHDWMLRELECQSKLSQLVKEKENMESKHSQDLTSSVIEQATLKDRVKEAHYQITEQHTTIEELRQALSSKTHELEARVNKELSNESLSAELTKSQRLLSCKETECNELKKILEEGNPPMDLREKITLRTKIEKLSNDLIQVKLEADCVISKANRRNKILEQNWRKSEDEVSKLDDFIDELRHALYPHMKCLLSFESSAVDSVLQGLGIYPGQVVPRSMKKKKPEKC